MLTSLFAAASVSAISSAPVLPTKVIAASLFKNGYAVVTREAQFSGSGTFTVSELPPSVLGTFWITASPGVKLNEVIFTTEETTSEREATSIEEILSLNLGKKLHFLLGDRRLLHGTLRSVAGGLAILEQTSDEGKPMGIRALPKGSIMEVTSDDGSLLWKLKQTTSQRVLRFKASATGKASLFLIGLERGLTWAPAYSVDITDAKKLHLVAKATLLNDLANLEGIELRLVTGFPNIPYINIWDPFTSQQSVDQWVSGLMNAGTQDAFRAQPGFSGQMAANARMAERDFGAAFPTNPIPGQQEEDLFFYHQPDVTLKRGDRGYYVLFTADAEFEHVYEWEILDQIQDTQYIQRQDVPDDVWHSLKFKNTSGRPFTTAAAVTMKNGELLGQDMMKYTTAGADATVRITKAMDVAAESAEEETERKRDALQLRSGYYDLVSLKGTLQVANRKADAIKLKVTKFLTGEVKAAEGNPKITALAKGLRAVNPRQRLEWTLALKAGEKKTVSYSYSVFINR